MRRAVLALLLLPLARPAPAQRLEIIKGVVRDERRQPIAGAQVVAIRAPDRATKLTNSDAQGVFRLEWSDGTGDYLVHVSHPGRKPFDKRVSRAPSDSVIALEVTLLSVAQVQTLAAVVTQAKKPIPDRVPDFGAGVGASERIAESVVGALAPELAGDLAAIAATQPGILVAPGGGISVLGLGAGQNSVTLNGMTFAGGEIPRDVKANVRVSTSSWDPSRGWFGGAQTNVELAPGELFGARRARLSLDAPAAQLTDPISRRLGQQFVNVQASGAADGELVDDRFYYNVAAQGARRTADYASLLTAESNLLNARGIAPDSAARLIRLSPAGALGATLSDRISRTSASLLGRIDHAPYDWKLLAPARSSWGLTGYANIANDDATGADVLSTPGHRGQLSRSSIGVAADYATYFAQDFLATFRSTVSLDRSQNQPLLRLPEARVRVNSALASGDVTPSILAFGGSSTSSASSRMATWESIAELQLYPPNAIAHRVKLTGDVRLDQYRQDYRPNEFGTYVFNSLADLASNNAASFSRNLSAPVRTGGEWNAFVALGDIWRVSDALQLAYGVRLEGSAFTSAPALNALVQSGFGRRTNEAPDGLHVSPRIGFTWNSSGTTRARQLSNQFGRFSGGPNGVLRGGVGEFRSLLPATLLSEATANTGLANSAVRVSCIGNAVPRADWTAWTLGAAFPAACASQGTFLDDAAPSVVLVDPSYSAPRSWRGNLAWTSALGAFTYSIEGLYSVNVNQPSAVDLNFAGAARFTVAEEGRPVFVNASDIVTTTGVVSPVGARTDSRFGRVLSNVADMRSTSRQLTLSLSPQLPGFDRWYFSLGYTLAQTNATQRGFDGSTFAAPTESSSARGDLDVRHQLLLQGGYSSVGLTATLFARLQSGLPYTPMVATDVNGDGLSNDRAFIFDPARTSDPALASSIRSLLGSASGASCLASQLGTAASRNSCESPWTASMNARLTATGERLGIGKRFDVALNIANPLAGVDQALHGSDNMRGWGMFAQPDPVLYTVRGFDPAARRYLYAVNSLFGSTQTSRSVARAPFRLTLEVSVDVGRSVPEQQLDKWLKPGRAGRSGERLSEGELKRRYARNVPDPYGSLLMQADSLLLTREQVTALQASRMRYRAHMDSLWTDLAGYLATLGDRYDAGEALARANLAIDEGWEYTRLDVQATLRSILTPAQLPILPFPARMFFNAKEKLTTRMFNQAG